MEYEYRVIDVADGAVSTVLLGDGRIETKVLEAYLNAMAADGWRLVFMEKVLQRYMLTSERETLMVTFERRVPEERRERRARLHMAGMVVPGGGGVHDPRREPGAEAATVACAQAAKARSGVRCRSAASTWPRTCLISTIALRPQPANVNAECRLRSAARRCGRFTGPGWTGNDESNLG